MPASSSRSQRADPTVLISGRYRLEDLLGEGGMARVYRAFDGSTGTYVALKQMKESQKPSRNARSRLYFRHEFHTMARLRHPRIVAVHDFGIDGGLPYYTMELLDGPPVEQEAKDLVAACRILRDVASALAFLHAKRLVHRDVGLANVRLAAGGEAKLIDFGVIASMGVVGVVAGTPPYLAPETKRGLPIDERADSYGLGALAYRLLTGVHAYPARTLEDLTEVWTRSPVLASQLRADVPEALDQLITSLMSFEPLARPTVAEAIDRISVIAQLEPLPAEAAAQAYLASAPLVGRKREMELLRARVARTVIGQGRSIVIEASSGMGKSRLLSEVGLEAQLAGAVHVPVSCDVAGLGPYGVAHELVRGLLAAAPAETLEVARPYAPIVVRAVPELREAFPELREAGSVGNPNEDRLRVQSQLVQMVQEIAHLRPLVLVIDDLQRCDESSAAVLAGLSHSSDTTAMLLVFGLRTDEPQIATAAIARIRSGSKHLRLRDLTVADLEELVRGLFGPIPHVERLAGHLHGMAGSSPLHAIELVRALVAAGSIRHAEGMWVVPERLDVPSFPQGLRQSLDDLVERMQGETRDLAMTLAVLGGEMPLEIVSALSTLGEARVFEILSELEQNGVLVGRGTSYRFRHDGYREALLRAIDPDAKSAYHRRVGEVLVAAPELPKERAAEIGWHLFRGGDRLRGAVLLEKAGRELFDSYAFADSIAPLDAAREVYEQEGKIAGLLDLEILLLAAGNNSNREVSIRFCDSVTHALERYSGLVYAERWRSVLGFRLSTALGIAFASLKWFFTRRSKRGPTPLSALHSLSTILTAAASVYAASRDIEPLKRLLRTAEHFKLFSGRVGSVSFLIVDALLAFCLGHTGRAVDSAERVLQVIDSDRFTPVTTTMRSFAKGGAIFVRGLVRASQQDPRFESDLQALGALDIHYFNLGSAQVRALYHRLRGEESRAREYESKADLLCIQIGSSWQMDTILPLSGTVAYALTRDLLGLKRVIEKLERLTANGYALHGFLYLARGEYYRERGQFSRSREELTRLLAESGEDNHFMRLLGTAAFAETALAEGKLEEAEKIATDGLAISADPRKYRLHSAFRNTRTLAVAEASLGKIDSARRRLAEALSEAGPLGSACLFAMALEACVIVEAIAGDIPAARLHLASMRQWCLPTQNPALIARVERLDAMTERRLVPRGGDDSIAILTEATQVALPEGRIVSQLLRGKHTDRERAEGALQLLVDAAQGTRGYLFLLRESDVLLAAPQGGAEPSDALVSQVRAILLSSVEGDEAMTEVSDGQSGHHLVVLRVARGDLLVPIGVVAVVGEGARDPEEGFTAEVAAYLYEAGDAGATTADSGGAS